MDQKKKKKEKSKLQTKDGEKQEESEGGKGGIKTPEKYRKIKKKCTKVEGNKRIIG